MTEKWTPPSWAAPTPQDRALEKLKAQQKATAAGRRWRQQMGLNAGPDLGAALAELLRLQDEANATPGTRRTNAVAMGVAHGAMRIC